MDIEEVRLQALAMAKQIIIESGALLTPEGIIEIAKQIEHYIIKGR